MSLLQSKSIGPSTEVGTGKMSCDLDSSDILECFVDLSFNERCYKHDSCMGCKILIYTFQLCQPLLVGQLIFYNFSELSFECDAL